MVTELSNILKLEEKNTKLRNHGAFAFPSNLESSWFKVIFSLFSEYSL